MSRSRAVKQEMKYQYVVILLALIAFVDYGRWRRCHPTVRRDSLGIVRALRICRMTWHAGTYLAMAQ
jgi:hypothetical protein